MKSLSPRTLVGGPGGGANNDGGVDYAGHLRRARLGVAIALTPVTMMFVAFTSAFLIRQDSSPSPVGSLLSNPVRVNLPFALLLLNSAVLLASTVCMEVARREITRRAVLAPVASIPGVSLGEEGRFPWLGATAVLGFLFLGGQWVVWRELAARGFYLASSPHSSMVYVLTAVHAVHLGAGLVALAFALASTLSRHRAVEAHCIVVDTTAWYWHYMGILWFYILLLLVFVS